MNPQQAAEELKVIRQLMERPVRYSTQSGLAAIVAGVCALVGLGVDWWVCRTCEPRQAFWTMLIVWPVVLVVAASGVLALTRYRERKHGLPAWSRVKLRILLTILPPFVAGAGLTAVIAWRWYLHLGPNLWGLIPAIWMSFYGVALWQLGDLGPRELRWLGGAFVLSALAAAAVGQAAPYLALGVTFGGYHIVYGTVAWMRYGG